MKKLIKAFCMSFSMFCAIPTPFSHVWEDSVRSLMLVVFPFVGTIIGGIWTAAAFLLDKINCQQMFSAAVLTVMPYLLTGGIHLDGYMDCCDAIFSRRPLEKKREILKDSHVGSFAVIALSVLILLGFAAFASGNGDENMLALIFICTVSRACSAIGVSTLRPMGHSEYAGSFQKSISIGNVIALGIIIAASFVISYFACGLHGLLSCVITAIGYTVFTRFAFKNLDGFSGDVTGFGHTLAELCGIITLMVF
ncbi:MAG: adenosylcobinamide-GDP ribazoletransferase [Oscillospiraceae bacterium]|nr:adenosylcobinamide-GDP ribazoletransferase [Oscillospiraceae bacterium]